MSKIINHTPRVFTIKNVLDEGECQWFIQLAEYKGFEEADVRTGEGTASMPSVRNNQRVLITAPAEGADLFARIRDHLPLRSGGQALGLPDIIRFYKYSPGQQFKMHKDGPWMEGGKRSRLTLLVYLNDNFSGGETDFKDFKIKPVQGDALVFVHDTWHEGCVIDTGIKYVLRSDIFYDV